MEGGGAPAEGMAAAVVEAGTGGVIVTGVTGIRGREVRLVLLLENCMLMRVFRLGVGRSPCAGRERSPRRRSRSRSRGHGRSYSKSPKRSTSRSPSRGRSGSRSPSPGPQR